MGLPVVQRDAVEVVDTILVSGSLTLKSGFFQRPGTKRKIAVSIRSLTDYASPTECAAMQQEVATLMRLDHPNILRILGCLVTSKPYFCIHEPATEGYLDRYLQSREIHTGQAYKYALDVAAGLLHLEQHGIVHWDVSARNILLNSLNSCKITNFGLCKSEDDASPPGFYFRYGQRMRHWPAPEVAEKRGALRKQSSVDAWGYGFFLYELVTQARIPYGDSTWLDDGVYQQTMHEIHQGALLPQPLECPDDLYDLMVECWDLEPQNRASFQRAKQRLASYDVIAELDFFLNQATEAAIAVANIGLTKDDAQGVTRPSSPVDEETQRLIDENAALKKQVDSLRGTVREKERQGTLTGKAAPASPRPGRKFKPTKFDTLQRQQHAATPCISDEVVSRFNNMFSPN